MNERAPIRWTPILVFISIAFGISWIVWLAIQNFNLPWWTGLAASWGPGIAALLVRGPLFREGFGDFGLFRLGSGRGGRKAYVVAVLLTALAAIASTAVGLAIGAFQLEWSPWRALLSPNLIVGFVAGHSGLIGLLVSFIVVPFIPVFELGEELGWRDYLVPRLLPLGSVPAYLISGVIWAAWHLPYNLVLGYNNGASGYPLFFVYIVLFGAVLAHLRVRSRTVWPSAVLHAAANYQPYVLLALTLVRPGFSQAGPAQSMALFLYGTMMLAGIVALVLAGRRRPEVTA